MKSDAQTDGHLLASASFTISGGCRTTSGRATVRASSATAALSRVQGHPSAPSLRRLLSSLA
jgi:hypothetical protein